MDIAWFIGFLEGEGCFSLNLRQSLSYRFYFQPACEFILAQDDEKLIKKIQKWLLTFEIESRLSIINRTNGKSSFDLRVYKKKSIFNLVKLLEKKQFEGKKELDFKLWCKGVKLLYYDRIKTKKDIVRFSKLFRKHNKGKNSIRKYNPAYITSLFNNKSWMDEQKVKSQNYRHLVYKRYRLKKKTKKEV